MKQTALVIIVQLLVSNFTYSAVKFVDAGFILDPLGVAQQLKHQVSLLLGLALKSDKIGFTIQKFEAVPY